MITLTQKDIFKMIKILKENLSVFAGDGENRRVLIRPGLKIKNIKSGINYTIVDVQSDGDKDLFINCYRADEDKVGVYIRLDLKDLKKFERI